MSSILGIDTKITLLAAGLIFLLALASACGSTGRSCPPKITERIPTSTSPIGRRCSIRSRRR